MTGRQITILQKEAFYRLLDEGFSPTRAGEMVRPQISSSSAARLAQGKTRAESEMRREEKLPDPKTFAQLSTDAKAALSDFNVACEIFLARRPSAWRRDAAMRALELITDRTKRSYEVVNIFPGAGKTTLWTHDIPFWLTAGGGTLDPAYGRAKRFLLGSYTMSVSTHYVTRLRRTFELVRPFWDKEQRREATHSVVGEFGRFKPLAAAGEEKLWTKDQFLVAQIDNRDIYEKEPTFMAASRESGFLGERFDYCAWDDLITKRNSRKFLNPEFVEEFVEWFEDEAETRAEPGGVLFLVGQRLGPNDLYRNRLDYRYVDEDGAQKARYTHTVYPAHHDDLCEGAGKHRQWDPTTGGCLTDAERLPWGEIIQLQSKPNYRTVYQQEDADPESVLVQPIWLDGGSDPWEFPAPGCYDADRGWMEHPRGVGKLLDYCVVDPSGKSGYWAVEWWAIQPETKFRYLIWGTRRKMQAGLERGYLDWDPVKNEHVGLMEELQRASILGGHPIRVWVVEQNSAHVYLFQTYAYRSWRRKYPYVQVIGHETQRNKADPDMGVEAALPMPYKSGMKRLPGRTSTAWTKDELEGVSYLKVKRRELTNYPHSNTSDTVMADWFGEFNLERIVKAAKRSQPSKEQELKLPAYLMRQRMEVSTRPA